jgi:hypothetical protein
MLSATQSAVRDKQQEDKLNTYLDTPFWDEITLVEHDDTFANTCTGERGRCGGVFGELHPLCPPSVQRT